jgi:hypothetical protein
MKVFVLVGDIEFIDGTAYVRKLKHALEVSDTALNVLDELGADYILPHYYKGRIVFDQFHDEDWHTNREMLIEKLDQEALEEKIQARRDADY